LKKATHFGGSNNELSEVNYSILLLDQKKRDKEKSSSLEGSREIGMKSTCGHHAKKQVITRSLKT
jgi:hypothetical protein